MQLRSAGSALITVILVVAPAALHASMEDIQAKYQKSAEAVKAGNMEEAAKLSGEALALAETELGPDDAQTGVLAYNTGVLYTTLGQWKEARTPLEQALANYGKVHGEDSPKLLPVMDKLGQVYAGMTDADAAAPMLERKLAIVTKANGEKSKQAADAMRDLSLAETLRGKHEKARRMQRKALGIYEDTVGEKSEEVGLLYSAMSFTEFSDPETGASKLDIAPKYDRKGLEILESIYPEGSPQRIRLYSERVSRLKQFSSLDPSGRAAKSLKELEDKLEAQKRIAAEKKAAGAQ
jgi:tetratricopeptide (TPR) repeat protein